MAPFLGPSVDLPRGQACALLHYKEVSTFFGNVGGFFNRGGKGKAEGARRREVRRAAGHFASHLPSGAARTLRPEPPFSLLVWVNLARKEMHPFYLY